MRGFTLVEVSLALVIGLLVGGVAQHLLLTQIRLARAQRARVAMQANLRGAALILLSELRELGGGTAGSDLVQIAAESISYRALRTTAAACGVWPDSVQLRRSHLFAYRQPQPGRDSLLLFVEGSTSSRLDDRWISLAITSATSGTACGSRGSVTLRTTLDTNVVPLADIKLDAPVRTFEVQQLKLYSQGGEYWLGTRSVTAGEVIQPLAGPLLSNGLEFGYFDSTNTATSVPSAVRSMVIRLRALTERAVHSGAGHGSAGRVEDSVSIRLALRNVPV